MEDLEAEEVIQVQFEKIHPGSRRARAVVIAAYFIVGILFDKKYTRRGPGVKDYPGNIDPVAEDKIANIDSEFILSQAADPPGLETEFGEAYEGIGFSAAHEFLKPLIVPEEPVVFGQKIKHGLP
jgi:hypothetical protein